ncbi:MAG: MBL fold metallo-hydrolase [Gemmatimonadota bacterium]
MRLTFLGTGTSFGVPVVGCDCAVCTSDDPRDRRTRHGALLSWDDGTRILVDSPPELRLQLVREGVKRIDAVWFTHIHADHLHGIDDLRIFSLRDRRHLPVFVAATSRAEVKRRFSYIFDSAVRPPAGTSKPDLELHSLEPTGAQEVAGISFIPLPVPHGQLTVLGFRVGSLGYVTDAKRLPPSTLELLKGVDTLVLNALWFGNPHPTHFVVEEAIEASRTVGARRTFLTHLTHRVGHRELEDRLPPDVRPAWDGLTIDVEEKP